MRHVNTKKLYTYTYDNVGRLTSKELSGKVVASYKYGYHDKVIEVDRGGKVTKFSYDGFCIGPIFGGKYFVKKQGKGSSLLKPNQWDWYRGANDSGDYSYEEVAVGNPDGGDSIICNGFNLHYGSNSDGCVTVTDSSNWSKIENVLNNTASMDYKGNTMVGIMIVFEK